MEKLVELSPHLAAYHPALLYLAVLCLVVLVQGTIAGAVGLGKNSPEVPGMPLKGSHQDFTFRSLRTYANSVENLPVFGFTLVLAVVGGASALWVNWLTGLYLVFRLVYWAVYYSGISKVKNGVRTAVYVMGALVNLVLAIFTLLALVT